MFFSSAGTIWNVFFSLILCDLECFFPHLVQFGMFFYLTLYDLECVFFSPYTIWNVLFPHLVQFRMFFLPDLVRFEMFFPQLARFGMVFFSVVSFDVFLTLKKPTHNKEKWPFKSAFG